MLGDDLTGILPELRQQAESQMADTFRAYSPGMGKVNGLDETTYTDEGETPGRLKGDASIDTVTRTLTIGDSRLPIIDGGLRIPIDQFVAADGTLAIVASEQRGTAWEFECVAVGPKSDPAMLGSRWMVVNVPVGSYATARRMDVVEVSKP